MHYERGEAYFVLRSPMAMASTREGHNSPARKLEKLTTHIRLLIGEEGIRGRYSCFIAGLGIWCNKRMRGNYVRVDGFPCGGWNVFFESLSSWKSKARLERPLL